MIYDNFLFLIVLFNIMLPSCLVTVTIMLLGVVVCSSVFIAVVVEVFLFAI